MYTSRYGVHEGGYTFVVDVVDVLERMRWMQGKG